MNSIPLLIYGILLKCLNMWLFFNHIRRRIMLSISYEKNRLTKAKQIAIEADSLSHRICLLPCLYYLKKK